MAWEKLGTASVSGAAANTSWKELARVTLSGANSTIDTGTFTAKDNMMILSYDLGNTSTPSTNGVRQFNSDTGNNYASRHRANGGGSNTATSDDTIQDSDNETPSFDVQEFANIAGQEKLVIGHQVIQSTAGAGNVPSRVENVGKWANTSNQVTSYQMKSDQNFNIGSEVVVLGYDNDEADSGTNFWQELASVELSSTVNEIDSGTFTAKKYLMVEFNAIADGSISGSDLQFNGDTGSNYARRYSSDGASDATGTSETTLGGGTGGSHIANNYWYIINKSAQEKLAIGEAIWTATGAGNAPSRRELTGKWANTSAQITSIKIKENASGGWTTGSTLKVYGAD